MERPSPHISVIMPVYNAAATLAEAMDSMLKQDYADWEIVAVDDGSTDGSLPMLQAYAALDGRVRVLSGDHGGIVSSLRRGCAAAQGDLLARMDADDIAFPSRLSSQARMFEGVSGPLLCGGRFITRGGPGGPGRKRYDAWINGLAGHEEIVREIFVECPLPHPTFMMPRAFYEDLGGYRDMGWPEDYDLVLRAWMGGARFAKPESPLLYWRDHGGRLSMTDPRYGEEAFRRLKRHVLFQTYLKEAGRPFIQWGAGEVGKRWLPEWPTPPLAVVDVHPRKIGRSIHGVNVITRDELPAPGACFIVVAVGARGARADIRSQLAPLGYRELEHFVFVA